MNIVAQLSDAIVEMYNAQDFSMSATAKRVYVPIFDLKETTDLKVFVLGLAIGIESGTRGKDIEAVTVKLAIYKKLEATDITSDDATAECDALGSFVTEVCDYFRTNRVIEAQDAHLFSIANEPTYDPQQLEKFGVYVSIVSLTYRILR